MLESVAITTDDVCFNGLLQRNS